MIMEGLVFTPSGRVDKAGSRIAETTPLEVRGKLTYVGRGGMKLAHALDSFDLPVQGLTALDVGASTGGFTDCLLQRGASRVYAVDVGRGQLDYRLRQDPQGGGHGKAQRPLPLPARRSCRPGYHGCLFHIVKQGYTLGLGAPEKRTPSHRPGQAPVRGGEGGSGPGRRHQRPAGPRQGPGQDHQLGHRQRSLRLRGLCASPILGDAGNREFFLLLQKP